MNVTEIKVSYNKSEKSDIKITKSSELYSIAIKNWNLGTIEMQEEVKVFMLDRSNKVIGVYELSKGGISSSIIDIKLLMSVTLKALASGIAIVHNHPSRNLNPSHADISITQKIKQACSYFEINFIDHLIISNDAYYSLAEEGNL